MKYFIPLVFPLFLLGFAIFMYSKDDPTYWTILIISVGLYCWNPIELVDDKSKYKV